MTCTPTPVAPLPLTAGDRSDRLDDLRERVQQVTVIHEVRRRRGRPNGAASRATLGSVNLAFVRYGADVTVDAFPTRGRFTVTFPLGPMGVRIGRSMRESSLTTGFVLSADDHTIMRPHPHAGALVVATSMGRLEEQRAADGRAAP